jgi:lipopolysaccharide export system protein LptC
VKVRRDLLVLVLLSLLAIASWWARVEPEMRSRSRAENGSPEYFANAMEVMATNEQGRLRHRLRAERLEHYLDDRGTLLLQPRLSVYEEDKPPWEIVSDRGKVSPGGELVVLQGDVTITRDEAPGTAGVRILTRDLRIQPDARYAETDQHVEIFHQNDWMESDGAQVWFTEPGRIKFLSHVRGRYEVN